MHGTISVSLLSAEAGSDSDMGFYCAPKYIITHVLLSLAVLGPLPIRANRYLAEPQLAGVGGGHLSSSAGCQGSGTGLRCQISSEWGSDEALGCWWLSPRIGRSARTFFA